jgi:hypothetical protein
MIQIQKSKKEKAESNSQTLAAAPKQNTASAPEEPAAAEEFPPLIVPFIEKKARQLPLLQRWRRAERRFRDSISHIALRNPLFGSADRSISC